jgi:hypothetical protein
MTIVPGDVEAVPVYVASPTGTSASQFALHAITATRMAALPPCVNGRGDVLLSPLRAGGVT